MSDEKPINILARKSQSEIIDLAFKGNTAAIEAVQEYVAATRRAADNGKCPVCGTTLIGVVQEDGAIHYDCGGHFAMGTFPKPTKKT